MAAKDRAFAFRNGGEQRWRGNHTESPLERVNARGSETVSRKGVSGESKTVYLYNIEDQARGDPARL